jgi:hypothetical protein
MTIQKLNFLPKEVTVIAEHIDLEVNSHFI